MNIFKRGMIFVTFFGCCFAMALMAASLGTKFWFEANAMRRVANEDSPSFRKDAKGHVHFGLFKGIKMLNWGIGERKDYLDVSSDITPLLSQSLWIATISCLCAALLMSVLAALFAVVNTATTPVETAAGVAGLYAWNGLAAVLGAATVVLWAVQYALHLKENVLLEDAEEGWTTKGTEALGYSFWLVVVAVVIHIANCVLIYIGTHEPKSKTQYEAPETKPGNIMLY